MTAESAANLLSVPTVVWSGLVAAIVSLTGAMAGVVLSNRSSERRLVEQLRHDAAEKQRDRLAALRREVYLKLFEELAAVGGHLGALAGKDPVSENLGAPLQAAMSQLGRVQLVGSQQTALLAGDLSCLYGEALFRLMLAAKPLHDLKIDISLADKSFQDGIAEAQRVNQEMQIVRESGKQDAPRMKALQDSFNHAKQTYQAAAAQRSASWEEFNSLQPQFMQAVFGELQAMASAQARLMDAMRQEIGLPSDLDFMLKRVRATQSRMHEAADALVRGLGTD
ncbi:hypothetical protein [Stenotrophomonas sp. CC120223-11]|uniref:hypothetical protein n=1 Tax=Stenotrophomonas sp. CC120223-11 TaxID=1378090 RepID=UPI000BCAEB3A|nr:hypothetical protein [Stenotrophomonas sp. CC120223-11]SNY65253.1 hypothetical protein SAMN02744784_01550 [Stenotrophomonas sp. CC120223-11]